VRIQLHKHNTAARSLQARREGILCGADRVRRRDGRHEDLPGGDIRPRPVHPAFQDRRGGHRQSKQVILIFNVSNLLLRRFFLLFWKHSMCWWPEN
jgi:hypothetical protein